MKIALKRAYEERVQLDREQEQEIRELYRELIEIVERDKERLSKDESVSASLKEWQLREIRVQLQRSLETVGTKVNGVVRQSMTTTSQQVVAANKDWLQRAGMPQIIVKAAYQNVPAEVVERVASGQLYKDNWTLSSAIWADIHTKQDDIWKIVAKGIALNKSSYDIAKDLESYVDPTARKQWDWNKVYPGVTTKIDYSAQRLARTAVSHAYQQAFDETVKPNPYIEAVQWNNAHSGRVCPLCIELAETDQYGLGEGVFPKGEEPLDHPNGMCYLTAVMVKSLTEIASDIHSWIAGAPNPALDVYARYLAPDYDEWFSNW